jgi:hypothetical protein
VDLAAFRVIQEALTNMLKHSGASHCRVSVGYQADGVTITVTDEGTGPYDGETGHGLAGIRERVAMYGGTFRAGPRPGDRLRHRGVAAAMSISVLIADDQELVRAGFRVLGDGVAAMAAAVRSHPDVALMDIRMPRLDGIEATAASWPPVRRPGSSC